MSRTAATDVMLFAQSVHQGIEISAQLDLTHVYLSCDTERLFYILTYDLCYSLVDAVVSVQLYSCVSAISILRCLYQLCSEFQHTTDLAGRLSRVRAAKHPVRV